MPSSPLAVWAGYPSLLCSVRLRITGTNVVEWNSRWVTRSTVPRFEVQVVMITPGMLRSEIRSEIFDLPVPSRHGKERQKEERNYSLFSCPIPPTDSFGRYSLMTGFRRLGSPLYSLSICGGFPHPSPQRSPDHEMVKTRSTLSLEKRSKMVEEILDKGLCEFEPIRTKEIRHKNMVYTHITTSKESCKGTKAFIVADLETILVKNTHTPYAAGLMVVRPGKDITHEHIDTYFSEDYSILSDEFEDRSARVLYEMIHRIEAFGIPVQLSAAITASARIHMYPYISRDDCYYSDTDSVVFGNPLNEEDLSPTELGKFKEEAKIKEGVFLAPKQYYFEDANEDKNTLKYKGPAKNYVIKEIFNEIYKEPFKKIPVESKLLAASRSSRMLDLDGESPVAENTTSLRPDSSSIGVSAKSYDHVWVDTSPVLEGKGSWQPDDREDGYRKPGLAFPAPTKNRPRENCNPRGIERKASTLVELKHRDRKTDYQGQSNREGKAIAKERRAKQKGKTEGTAIQATNDKAIELGNPPERLHPQSLKHERDGIDRLKKGVKG
ncbi:DNA polymerase-like protein [Tanacetum coccineum]